MANGYVRSRGRIQPANLAELIKESHERHKARGVFRALAQIALPPSFDARSQGWVGPIKDQGQCGSCWDFSGTGVIEIAYNKAGVGGGADKLVLSEQYTLDCCRNGGCSGDDNTTVLAYAKSKGLPLSADYGSYVAGSRSCKYNSNMHLYGIADWGFADSNGGQGVTSTADIKAAIMAYGCVGAAIAADNSFEVWGENNPSMDKPFMGSGSRNIDHDIILVGWKDDPSLPGGGYWILRNSWGVRWGVNGYMSICYGANLVGTESVFVTAPSNVPPSPTPVPPVPPSPTPGPCPWLKPGLVHLRRALDELPGEVSINYPALMKLLGDLANNAPYTVIIADFAALFSSGSKGFNPGAIAQLLKDLASNAPYTVIAADLWAIFA